MAVVDAYRCRGALAGHADDAALRDDRRAAADGRCRPRGLTLRRHDPARVRLRRCLLIGVDQLEFSVSGHRVLVLLSQEVLGQKDVEIRRKCVRVLALKKRDRPRVLLAAEDQLGFLFTLRGGAPGREGHAQEDRHDRHADQ